MSEPEAFIVLTAVDDGEHVALRLSRIFAVARDFNALRTNVYVDSDDEPMVFYVHESVDEVLSRIRKTWGV